MAHASDPNFEQSKQLVLESVRVHDTILLKARHDRPAGVVVILESFPAVRPERYVGEWVRLIGPDCPTEPQVIRAVRDHGTTISFLLEGLGRAQVPIGSTVEFSLNDTPIDS